MLRFLKLMLLVLGIVLAPTVSRSQVAVDSTSLRCLALNIAREAPDEPYDGKLAVATVTMNRVKSAQFPNTVCGVVYQRNPRGCQFSWVCERPRSVHPKIYQDAVQIAHDVLAKGRRLAYIGNALYFHATHVNPTWSRDGRLTKVTRIGNHIFYRPTTRNRTT